MNDAVIASDVGRQSNRRVKEFARVTFDCDWKSRGTIDQCQRVLIQTVFGNKFVFGCLGAQSELDVAQMGCRQLKNQVHHLLI